MDIDPEKLEEALSFYGDQGVGPKLEMILAAARAHLATLPRWKEVERECWEVVSDDGVCRGFFPTKDAADGNARLTADRHVVRLTGTAKVRA